MKQFSVAFEKWSRWCTVFNKVPDLVSFVKYVSENAENAEFKNALASPC